MHRQLRILPLPSQTHLSHLKATRGQLQVKFNNFSILYNAASEYGDDNNNDDIDSDEIEPVHCEATGNLLFEPPEKPSAAEIEQRAKELA